MGKISASCLGNINYSSKPTDLLFCLTSPRVFLSLTEIIQRQFLKLGHNIFISHRSESITYNYPATIMEPEEPSRYSRKVMGWTIKELRYLCLVEIVRTGCGAHAASHPMGTGVFLHG
jgi:hypothetical protein